MKTKYKLLITIGIIITVLVVILGFSLTHYKNHSFEYYKNIDIEKDIVEYNPNTQKYGIVRKLHIKGKKCIYPFEKVKSFYSVWIYVDGIDDDYKNIHFYPIKFMPYYDEYLDYHGIIESWTNLEDTSFENIHRHQYVIYTDDEFDNLFMFYKKYLDMDVINSDTKLTDKGDYTIFTTYRDKKELEYHFNNRHELYPLTNLWKE